MSMARAIDFSTTSKSPGDVHESDSATDSGRDNIDEEDVDGDYGSYRNHVFSDPKVAAYWRDVYDKATYEGRHRFDPSFTWSATEEKRVKRKVCRYSPQSIP